jgi:hydrogenase-4 component B
MLLGFGIGIAFFKTNSIIAAVGLIGGLFHLMNHACFKGLLFLNAGAFETATGERDLNKLGGLGKLLPLTGLCTIIASLSIAGVPPFNGFASKWLLYHASIWSGRGAAVFYILFAIAAIFISAVTLASFIKFVGATVLGTPSPAVLQAKDKKEGPWLGLSQLFLAFFCLGFGLLPQHGAWLCHRALEPLFPLGKMPDFVTLFGSSELIMTVSDKNAVVGLWSPVVVGGILVVAFLVALGIRRIAAAPRRTVPVWSCGSAVPEEQLRFRAAGYYTPFKKFVHIIVPEWKISWRPKQWPIVTKILNIDKWLFEPLIRGILALFRLFAKSHVGVSQVYAYWIVIGLTVAVLFLFLYKGGA